MLEEPEEGIELLAAVPQLGAHALFKISCRSVVRAVQDSPEIGQRIAYLSANARSHVDDLEPRGWYDVEIDLERLGHIDARCPKREYGERGERLLCAQGCVKYTLAP